ncbi:hypothetical protein M9H77_23864 [Catharanthus roseus]|uniref:Uncharacterized protein n=1 Tax=Catharanthus roseus TaxID=4058 RepID=A0ACC0AUX5_CATRO|nr:hypothetical protein M9H77_23864 [Catharanthus roseus]
MKQSFRNKFGVENYERQRQCQAKGKIIESSMGEKSTKSNKLSQAQDVADKRVIHIEKKNTCTFGEEEKSRAEKVKSVLYASFVTFVRNVMVNPLPYDLAFGIDRMLKCSSPCASLEIQLLVSIARIKPSYQDLEFLNDNILLDFVVANFSSSCSSMQSKIHIYFRSFVESVFDERLCCYETSMGFNSVILISRNSCDCFCVKKMNGSFKVLKVHRCDLVKTTFENGVFELTLKDLGEKLVYPISVIDCLLKRDILKDFLVQNTTSCVKLLIESFGGILTYSLIFKEFLDMLISLLYCKEKLDGLSPLKETGHQHDLVTGATLILYFFKCA